MLKELKQKIVEALEDKSKFIKPTHGTCCTCQRCGHDSDRCICRIDDDLTLEDVLRATLIKNSDLIDDVDDMRRIHHGFNWDKTRYSILDIWKLSKPLSEQSTETIEFLYKLLKD